MVSPIDYSGAFGGVDPLASFTQAAQAGVGIRNMQLQQTQLEQQQAQQKQLQADMAALSANPTPQAIAQMAVKYPQLSEQFKRSYDMLDSAQQQSRLNASVPIFAAIQSGRNDLAAQQLRDRATALTNAGQDGEAKQISAMADLVEQHPETARLTIGTLLASTMGPDKFAETFGKLGAEQRAQEQAPGALRKVNADASAAEADATTKGVQAKYAEPTVLKDLEQKGWNIENIKSEIGYRKEANRIAAMNAAANRESNDLKRQELGLKIQETQQALADKARAKVADVESATSTIDNLINTVDRIKKNPALNDVLGSIEGRLPSVMSDNGADAIALIDTLGSQAFMSQIPAMKGTGALSEKEGEKLQSSLQNLSRTQSERQFRDNLDEVQRLMLKARKNVEMRYGVKAAPPDTPAVQSTPEQINALVSKYLNPQPPGAR